MQAQQEQWLEMIDRVYAAAAKEHPISDPLQFFADLLGDIGTGLVSPETIISQLKSLFLKTNVHKRGELIHLAHSVNIPVDHPDD